MAVENVVFFSKRSIVIKLPVTEMLYTKTHESGGIRPPNSHRVKA